MGTPAISLAKGATYVCPTDSVQESIKALEKKGALPINVAQKMRDGPDFLNSPENRAFIAKAQKTTVFDSPKVIVYTQQAIEKNISDIKKAIDSANQAAERGDIDVALENILKIQNNPTSKELFNVFFREAWVNDTCLKAYTNGAKKAQCNAEAAAAQGNVDQVKIYLQLKNKCQSNLDRLASRLNPNFQNDKELIQQAHENRFKKHLNFLNNAIAKRDVVSADFILNLLRNFGKSLLENAASAQTKEGSSPAFKASTLLWKEFDKIKNEALKQINEGYSIGNLWMEMLPKVGAIIQEQEKLEGIVTPLEDEAKTRIVVQLKEVYAESFKMHVRVAENIAKISLDEKNRMVASFEAILYIGDIKSDLKFLTSVLSAAELTHLKNTKLNTLKSLLSDLIKDDKKSFDQHLKTALKALSGPLIDLSTAVSESKKIHADLLEVKYFLFDEEFKVFVDKCEDLDRQIKDAKEIIKKDPSREKYDDFF